MHKAQEFTTHVSSPSLQLNKRRERREETEKDLAQAKEEGDQENIDKFNRRLVKVTRQHNEDCKKLLKLMGIPYVDVRAVCTGHLGELCPLPSVLDGSSNRFRCSLGILDLIGCKNLVICTILGV
jgi:hypothetical protein